MPSVQRLLATALVCISFVTSAWADVDVAYLASERAKSLNLPFSEAVRVGNMLYLSGQLGNLPGTMDLAAGGIEGQTRQVMTNIQRILEANNSALEWADMVGVLSQARKEIKKRGVKIDSQRWQCCLNQELLAMVQSGREEAALEALLTNLTDGNSEGLCSRTDQCSPEKCASLPVNSHR